MATKRTTPKEAPLSVREDVRATVRAEGEVHEVELVAGPVPDDLHPAVIAYLVELGYVVKEDDAQ